MGSLIEKMQGMVDRIGFHAYIGIAGVIILELTALVAFFILIYSLFSHNWKPWKFIRNSVFAGLGLILLSVIIAFLSGILQGIGK